MLEGDDPTYESMRKRPRAILSQIVHLDEIKLDVDTFSYSGRFGNRYDSDTTSKIFERIMGRPQVGAAQAKVTSTTLTISDGTSFQTFELKRLSTLKIDRGFSVFFNPKKESDTSKKT